MTGSRAADPAPQKPADGAGRKPAHEQRRHPRIRIGSSLYGYGVEGDVSVTIRDVSQGGFALESPVPFAVGAEQTFLFTSADGQETLVRCQCRHARMTTSAAGAAVCVAGFEFLPQPEENLKVVLETIRRFTRPKPDGGSSSS
jgi:hypothetical protein